MNDFIHILHYIHLQYKHKIKVFKFLIIVTMATGIAKKMVLLSRKDILRKMSFAQGKCEIETFQTGFVIQVIFIILSTRSV